MMGRTFPVHPDDARTPQPHAVPWAWIEKHAKAVQRLTDGQTLEQLASRGGLAWVEMLAAARGLSLREAMDTVYHGKVSPIDAQRYVLELVQAWAAENSGHVIALDCGHGHSREPGKPCAVCFPPTNPPPQMGTAPATWDLVKADIDARDRFGTQKYGVRHQFDNGRDHLQDAYEECLDMAVYLRAEIERRRRSK